MRWLALFLVLLVWTGCGAPDRPPNIVLLFSDDAGYADFGFQGSQEIRTPHLDALAAAGVRFTNGYVTASVCAPSRAGLITGRYQQRFGFEYNLPGQPDPSVPDSVRGLPLTERTMADELSALGYATGLVGKWHLGTQDRFHPLNRGFDWFFGMRQGGSPYMPGRANRIESGMAPVPADSLDYLTDEFGHQAVGFIERNVHRPFFLFVSFNAPHTPMQARAADLVAAGEEFETELRAANAAMTKALDDQVGRIRGALDSLGLAENTIVVFVNDNGGAMPYNGSLNAPLRGTKGTALEGGNRVPFLLSWPGRISPGEVYSRPVSTLDLLPTFVRAAGGEPADKLDGVDLAPYLTGAPGVPHDTLYWKLNWGAAIRVADYKLVRTPAGDHWLFDLASDPEERIDLSESSPALVRDLAAALKRWENMLPPPVWTSADRWREHSLLRYDQDIVDGFIRR